MAATGSEDPEQGVTFELPLPPRGETEQFGARKVHLSVPRGGERSEASSRSRRTHVGQNTKAEVVLHKVVPDLGNAVLNRLEQERIYTAGDLAGLDKDDLRQLGFTMAQWSRVLRWARAFDQSSTVEDVYATRSEPLSVISGGRGDATTKDFPAGEDDDQSPFDFTEAERDFQRKQTMKKELMDKQDSIQGQADFWCDLVSKLGWATHGGEGGADLDVLEELFDLSYERMREVYHSMRQPEDDDECISVDALGEGLERWGLPPIDEGARETILELVDENNNGRLEFIEFQTILSRLLLARLLASSRPGIARGTTEADNDDTKYLRVVDYNSFHGPEEQQVRVEQKGSETWVSPLQFFFGHRRQVQAPSDPRPRRVQEAMIRWMHMKAFDETWLLALAVKYGLHPLAVEDVMEKSPTKFDRFGQHFFITLEKMYLCSDDHTKRIAVGGTHLSIFCAGPPAFDTILTISQTEPGYREKEQQFSNQWFHKVNKLISSPHSRIRERRGNFLLYKIVDECADELLNVTRAYSDRIQLLEVECRDNAKPGRTLWQEVSQVKQELSRVERRAKGLHRVVKRIVDDPDLAVGLSGYMDDIQEHLEEVQDDSTKLIEKCDGVLATHAQHQESVRAKQADQQNNILFVLTIVTAVFTPMTFIAGVYGMNFVDKHNHPTIPELTWKHGYAAFWIANLFYLIGSSALLYCLFVWPGYWRSSMLDANEEDSEREPLLPRKPSRRPRVLERTDSFAPSHAQSQHTLTKPAEPDV